MEERANEYWDMVDIISEVRGKRKITHDLHNVGMHP